MCHLYVIIRHCLLILKIFLVPCVTEFSTEASTLSVLLSEVGCDLSTVIAGQERYFPVSAGVCGRWGRKRGLPTPPPLTWVGESACCLASTPPPGWALGPHYCTEWPQQHGATVKFLALSPRFPLIAPQQEEGYSALLPPSRDEIPPQDPT